MTQTKRPRHVLSRWAVASTAVLFVLVVAPAIATAQGDDAQCLKPELPPTQEGRPPPIKALVFNGDVTIGGNAPSRQDYTITARIGQNWESVAVPVGVGSSCGKLRYEHLLVAPPEELDLFGSEITFWLNGQVRSHDVDQLYVRKDLRYALEDVITPTWTFPILREVDLEFPALPDGYRPVGSLPATGGASLGKPMIAVFLILGLLATVSGLIAVRRCYPKTTFLSP